MSTTTTERRVARTDLCRVATFTLRARDDADREDDGRTIDGYAAVYGRDLRDGETPARGDGWSLIDSWEGTFYERFVYGSFRKSLRETKPRMQFDHGRHPLLGSLPLGTWESVSEEPDAGLHTVGRMSDSWIVEPFRQAIVDEAVDGMSIRFAAVNDLWETSDGRRIKDDEELLSLLWRPDATLGPLRRTVREAKLFEAGPVTWPAYDDTSVGVRSVTIDLGRLRDPAQRSQLARAVLLADLAEADAEQRAGESTDGTDSTDSTDSTDTPDPASAPQATATEAAGEHATERRTTEHDDTPQATGPKGAAGEHESDPIPQQRDYVDAVLARRAARGDVFDLALDECRAALITVE